MLGLRGNISIPQAAPVAATTVASAAKLTTARIISVTGDASGSVSFDGSADVGLALTVVGSGGTGAVVSVAGRTGAVTLSAADISGLATVATSGLYSDLAGKPSIPAATSSLTNDSGFINTAGARSAISATGSLAYNSTTGVISYTAPTLATVATTGAYADLSGKPTLGTLAALNSVALTNIATQAASTFVANNTAGVASPTAITAAAARTLLGLATVATTGAYTDLTGRPTLATVATSGAYADLSGKPTLATVATSGNTADLSTTINNQSATTYTLTAGDHGKIVILTNAAAITLTLPNSLAAGFSCLVIQGGAGQVTFSPAAGATLANRQSFTKSAAINAACSLLVMSNAGSAAKYLLGGDGA